MQTVSNDNFGPLVAYLVPGAIVLFGFSEFSPTLQPWFATVPSDAPTIGGFLYLTVASLAVGLTVSAVRWALLDTVHRHTGLRLPLLDFSRLGENVAAFELLIEIHYRHYLHYGNTFVAAFVAYLCYRVKHGLFAPTWGDLAFVAIEAILFAASRDTLRKYHTRAAQLLHARHGQ